MIATFASLLFASFVSAHMEMSWPYPLRSRHDSSTPSGLIDYNMKAPLAASGADFPCKGYQSNTPQNMVTTYVAGSKYNMSIEGSASHGGGSCQLSLSYDGGQTFKVIKSMIGGCPLQSTYDFTIPASAPEGHALFAWTWSNFMGNREFYMNCASVHVSAAKSYKAARDGTSSFNDLPNIWVADLASVNTCTTNGPNGSLNPVYPDPGPDVVYGGGMSSSSPATPGSCEVPRANRQVVAPSFSFDPIISTTVTSSSVSTASASILLLSTSVSNALSVATTASSISTASASILLLSTSLSLVQSTSSSSSSSLATLSSSSSSQTSSSSRASSTYSSLPTITMTVDCPATVTITLAPTAFPGTYTISAPASACTGSSAICPCAVGYSCMAVGQCEWACMASPATNTASFRTSVLTSSTTLSASAITGASIPSSSTPPTSGNTAPSFANVGALRSYLPCVPGTFICTDASTWYTCDREIGGGWSYQYPRQVAGGMQCQPYLSPAGSNQYGQQGNTPQGYYRDDKYSRAGR